MGVFKRYKDAQAALKDAENAMPGAYQSNYTDRINQALDALGAGTDSAADVGTDSALYRQYRGNATQNARAAAENAAAGAAALSGGYGSSYANSAAQQGYQQEMANVDNGLAGLREKALNEYQVKKSGLSELLSGLMNQDSLEAGQHQTAVSNAQNWRDYKLNRAGQAASEKESFLDRSVQNISNIVNAVQKSYDLYKGYTQQERAMALQEKAQDEQLRQMAIDKALEYKGKGASNAFLDQFLSSENLDSSIFNDWTTGSEDAGLSLDQYIKLANTASSLISDGQVGAAQDLYRWAGIDPSILNTSIQTAAGRSGYGSSGGSSRRGSSSSGSGDSNTPKKTTYTVSQLQSIAKEFRTMKTSDPLYAHYKQVLTENGWIKADNAVASSKSGEGSLPVSPQERMAQKYGTVTNTGWTGIPEKKSGGTTTGTTQSKGGSTLSRVQVAANAIKGQRNKGYANEDITYSLLRQGYTEDEIFEAMNLAG